MQYFKYPTYERTQVKLLTAYAGNMIAYLRRLYPDQPIELIRKFVTDEITAHLKRPKLTLVDQPSYGNANLETTDLLTYTETMRQNIITPAGVLYVKPSVKLSFLKKKLTDNLTARKVQKKRMLNAISAGDQATEQRAHYLQASIKIETNSIPGAFGSMYNCISDVPNYNAVTAVARHSIMCGYAHVEKLLEGNYYFPSIDHCINYCIQLVRVCPPTVLAVVEKYHLYRPSVTDLYDHFATSLRLYMRISPAGQATLLRLFASLSEAERIFIYYAYCLKTLIRKNESFFRTFFTRFFSTAVPIDPTAAPEDIYKLNGDLLAMLSGLNADIIQRKTVADAIVECPDGVRHLLAVGTAMQQLLDDMGDLFATFLRVDCDVADAMVHPNMIRKTVIISDTDSVIFSTQSWMEWYTGKVSFEKPAYEINGFVVMMITLTLEQVFARLSTNMGAEGSDIYKIAMKNEFLYPLLLRTPLPKQYAGRAAIQEGFVLPKPKNDIKGLSFRSSAFCPETAAAGTEFVNWLFDEVMANGSTTATACLQKVLAHERRVITSLQAGERTFLTTTPVRLEHEYKNPAISVFFYWKLWNAVFRPNFGEFVIPTKGYDIPILGDGAALQDPRYLAQVEAYDAKLHTRLQTFMAAHPRKITRLIIPMTLKRVPEIIRPLIDVRGIVYDNSTPFIITLRSLGLGYATSKHQCMLSDIYA